MMALKVALAGIGKIARDQHIPAITASPDWELAATVSRHATVDGVESHDDFGAMLEARPDIGVVSLCMPPVPRFDYARAAIAAGRHVMLEKPPGATVSECHALEAMARAAGVSIYATWHSREAAMVATAKAWLEGKRLESLIVTWKEDVRKWHPGQTWIWQAGGLGVFDPGINALSIVTEILADPIHLTASELFIPENCETPIAATLAFAHPHGAQVSAEFDFRKEGDQFWNIAIRTDQGSLVLSEGGATLEIDGVSQTDAAGDALKGEYPRLYARMANLVRAGGVDMDLAPMAHVADAFLLGKRITVEPFVE
ncbi:MAG: Gfo/Idh/MocA family oxidoreductase [Hoeflea sp.]|uniref:Gfo/Idh/MocA family protein n=1 Tax=Hoeflea sp. TaxID=1940281 RepID=UPI001D9CD082|nr:Gfo/Idh/MocA family oxidoreductase [Hoeflea sp.]MBV1723851.1 Gfo/Idh/MocA family oxidoreductase [Hoeflea sp.]MBV1763128.1 Gfo/Idh/MocA family oxidoreductase [Hoeflea sp.]MBV1784691.1 Gfo/Idh/MocA family oxidoreductase [Hoeflea sp.]